MPHSPLHTDDAIYEGEENGICKTGKLLGAYAIKHGIVYGNGYKHSPGDMPRIQKKSPKQKDNGGENGIRKSV